MKKAPRKRGLKGSGAGEKALGEVHANTIENVFSVLKREMVGVYQDCGEAHLRRYLAEFDFRSNRQTAPGSKLKQAAANGLQASVNLQASDGLSPQTRLRQD